MVPTLVGSSWSELGRPGSDESDCEPEACSEQRDVGPSANSDEVGIRAGENSDEEDFRPGTNSGESDGSDESDDSENSVHGQTRRQRPLNLGPSPRQSSLYSRSPTIPKRRVLRVLRKRPAGSVRDLQRREEIEIVIPVRRRWDISEDEGSVSPRRATPSERVSPDLSTAAPLGQKRRANDVGDDESNGREGKRSRSAWHSRDRERDSDSGSQPRGTPSADLTETTGRTPTVQNKPSVAAPAIRPFSSFGVNFGEAAAIHEDDALPISLELVAHLGPRQASPPQGQRPLASSSARTVETPSPRQQLKVELAQLQENMARRDQTYAELLALVDSYAKTLERSSRGRGI